ncbi:class I SAM-dependent methyltransferase [Aeromicrobium sp.]|uniref:class I SAM-dependent methyltransferase n=1 Tax=Aeromicrobium sp. TaxID=1871063 RepID=UPI003D6B1545
MTEQIIDEDAALKAKHRAMWELGNYAAVAAEIIPELGTTLVEACDVRPGVRVLDVAAGTGNAAIPAALTGASVMATDLAPELLEIGKKIAADRGATLKWVEADAENMPCFDGEYDIVMSSVGVMFAPHHQAAADELVRVVRPGGTIGNIAWTPEGFIGQMFAAMKPYAPPPPPGAQPPPLWGDESHVRKLLGDRVTDVRAERRSVVVDDFAGPSEFREYFKKNYGPTIAVYKFISEDPERVAALDAALDDLAKRFTESDGTMKWEYLLFTATKS